MKQYDRDDQICEVRAEGDTAVVEIRHDGRVVMRWEFARGLLDRASDGETESLAAALNAFDQEPRRRDRYSDGDRLVRRVLHVQDRRWARIPWNRWSSGEFDLVRASAVPARIAQVPLTLPLRMVEVGPSPVIERALETVFGGSDRSFAIVNLSFDGKPWELSHELTWPTVDVLHLRSPGLTGHDADRLLRWLPRFVDDKQTRLVVLEVAAEELPQARWFAQMLIDRGGPAVWVAEADRVDWIGLPGFAGFYAFLVHDRPLDWIHAVLGNGELFAGAGREELLRYSALAQALADRETVDDLMRNVAPAPATTGTDAFARADASDSMHGVIEEVIRETARSQRLLDRSPFPVLGPPNPIDSAVRQNVPALKRLRFGSLLSAGLASRGLVSNGMDDALLSVPIDPFGFASIDDLTRAVMGSAYSLDALVPEERADALQTTLHEFGQIHPQLVYEDHESEGLLPLAAKLAHTRALLEQVGNLAESSKAIEPRHVNAAFYDLTERGVPRLLPPREARFAPGQAVYLGVRVGRRDQQLVALGSTALIEEIDRSPEGMWLDIGVTAIDFELIGDPVQPLWLPGDGQPTSLATFAMRLPADGAAGDIHGVARLRVSLFHQQNLLQSFLVAARFGDQDGHAATGLAQALDVEAHEIEAVHTPAYLARREYSAASVAHADAAKERALTLIANENAGRRVVTIKGDELFEVCTDDNLPDAVATLRKALDRVTGDANLYKFAYKSKPNAGDPAKLLDALWGIATAGWSLFSLLLPDQASQRLVRERVQRGGTVHAAHVSASKPIPWALIYDRPVFDRDDIADPDRPGLRRPVERALCTASLPNDDGSMPDVECGDEGCLLHPRENVDRDARNQPRVCSETVICPRRFWGFNAAIEVPVRRIRGLGAEKAQESPLPTAIAAAQPVDIAAAFNPKLSFSARHKLALDALVRPLHAVMRTPAAEGRTLVVDELGKGNPDAVYLFCHALMPQADKFIGPSLDFGLGHQGQVKDVLEAHNFNGAPWAHGPLVFLNGCDSVGFSPNAPSPFVDKFIEGRGAAAVIGTEVAVFEVLAAEFAEEFFKRFLDHETAGSAMLLVRRQLLAKNNPLGLVYTLYGSADLALRRSPPPAAAAAAAAAAT